MSTSSPAKFTSTTTPTQFVDVGGRRLAYRSVGEGKPLVLCNRFRGVLREGRAGMTTEQPTAPVETPFTVRRREYATQRSFEELVATFEREVPQVDGARVGDAVARAKTASELESFFASLAGPTDFMRFTVFDHGAWLTRVGTPAKVRSYVLGNPLIAKTMLVHDLRAGLDVPVRVVIFEVEGGRARLAYDVPSTLLSGLQNAQVTAAAEQLDAKLAHLAEVVTRTD